MRKLYKHPLPFDKALAFCIEALEGTNIFSDEILKIISQGKGKFFTLLPQEANLNYLHQFDGSILPPQPKRIGPVGSLSGIYTYAPVDSMEKEFATLLSELMHTHSYNFLSDHFNATYREGEMREWFGLYGVHYLKEVYYFLSSKNSSPEIIEKCLHHSKTFWHSLCILNKNLSLDITNKTLQLPDIQEFCKSAQLVLVGSYDGEGYIIWEKEKEDKKQQNLV